MADAINRYRLEWDKWAKCVDTATQATFQLSGSQLSDLQQDASRFQAYLNELLSTPDGQQKAIMAGSQLSTIQIQEALQLSCGAAIGAMVTGSNTIQNVKDASKVAGMEEATGLGKATSMAKFFWGVRQDAKTSSKKSLSTRTQFEMQERLERTKMGKDKSNNGGNA